MSHTVSLEKAAATFADLIGELKPGDEIVVTSGDRPVARILSSVTARSRRRAGVCKGMLTIIKEDDDHLRDFAEYVP